MLILLLANGMLRREKGASMSSSSPLLFCQGQMSRSGWARAIHRQIVQSASLRPWCLALGLLRLGIQYSISRHARPGLANVNHRQINELDRLLWYFL